MNQSADRKSTFHSFHLTMTNADAEMQYAAGSINCFSGDFIHHHLQYKPVGVVMCIFYFIWKKKLGKISDFWERLEREDTSEDGEPGQHSLNAN